MSRARLLSLALLVLSFASTAPAQSADIRSYIQNAWTTLRRSTDDCKTITDERHPDRKQVIYFPADQPLPAVAADLARRCNVDTRQLPKPITAPGTFDADHFSPHGLLYLPHPYIVPGGFFNEMYGWDSYFIIRGLLLDNHLDLARGMVENFFYEIEHYGSILNANRTYFLTRSQPPFLSAMVMAIYDAKPDHDWLIRAYPYIERDYHMWTSGKHLAGITGLSRYYDYGQGPTPDIAAVGDPYYAEVISALATSGIASNYQSLSSTIGPRYTVTACVTGAACAAPAQTALTADYYQGDRAMRESGFDVSNRFGPYSGKTHHFAPVCLNSLLYQTEKNLQRIAEILNRPADAKRWAERARTRQQLMEKYFWDPQKKMYFDWNFTDSARSTYEYATTFYPLWVGLASPDRARDLISNLAKFEQPGGIVMSTYDTRLQWDFPYGWAPINLITIEGLRHYHADEAANRLSRKFITMVAENFQRDGTIREKYNVVTRTTEQNVTAGYHVNVIGFGWTNATFLALWNALPNSQKPALSTAPKPASTSQRPSSSSLP
ncbi:MAG TPA: trehalase family glycosidase [Terriglobales bacterium]|nr:trehalase family glycosidase [Terriglobales bacterium]